MKKLTFFLLILLGISQGISAQEDQYQWLEDVDSKKSLDFVNAQNKATIDKLSKEKDYQTIYDKSLAVYNSSDRIEYPRILGKYIYNFWKDKDHERGIWRRSPIADYTNGKPTWETLIDIDALSKKDSIKWVFKGANGLYPQYNRFLILLSKGGGDAVVIKEFDPNSKQFIENGFYIDEAKGGASYVDENTLIISSNFGEGTMTSSGYPKQARVWKRGTLLKDAQIVYEGQTTDVGVWAEILLDGTTQYRVISRGITTFSSQTLVWMNNRIITLAIPEDASISGILNNQLIVQLRTDWTVNSKSYKSGTLISLNFTELLKGTQVITTVMEPDEFSSINEVLTTKNKLLINVLNNVNSQLYCLSFANQKWASQKVNAPEMGTISLVTSDELSDNYFYDFQNFITPSTLFAANASDNTSKAVKSLPAYFDASKYEVKQYKVKSKDGTLIPYFMVASKNIMFNGNNPTLVYAYGGFEVSSQPYYAATIGMAWLDNGGVYVLANIRGGGEYGPKWHQAGVKEKRQNVFNDLYAVTEDLITKKVSSPKHLGVMGGSNGGLLVGVAFTQRPDLYNAVVCQVPLLDMKRYNKLLAGASWMGEYGNPDIPAEWEYIQKYSPYQNLKKDMKYPEVFFATSTRDDRVHPGHARKMVAKMNDMGYKTYYYENTEGGHAGSSTNEQKAREIALEFSYLLMKLK